MRVHEMNVPDQQFTQRALEHVIEDCRSTNPSLIDVHKTFKNAIERCEDCFLFDKYYLFRGNNRRFKIRYLPEDERNEWNVYLRTIQIESLDGLVYCFQETTFTIHIPWS